MAPSGRDPPVRTSSRSRSFTIDAKTGVFAFAAPDHEPPMDPDGDNEYRAVVFATDPNGDSDSIRIRVTVKDGPALPD